MNLIQSFISVVFIMAFLTLAFLAMWYIALPLLLIGAIVWIVQMLRVHWLAYRTAQQANGCRIREIHPEQSSHRRQNVIDVDYTEVSES